MQITNMDNEAPSIATAAFQGKSAVASDEETRYSSDLHRVWCDLPEWDSENPA